MPKVSPPPSRPILLLVDDAPSQLDAWRQALAALGGELVVAQPPAEALRLFGRRLPAWVALSPACARGRGRSLYAELRRHPYAARARFILLGERLPGHEGPVWPEASSADALRARLEALPPPEAREVEGAVAEPVPAPPRLPLQEDSTPARVLPLPPAIGSGAWEGPLAQLCRRLLGQVDQPGRVKLSVEGEGTVRTLWLAHGKLVAAETAVPAESLLERARLDGLVTAAEVATLQPLRRAGMDEQLLALRARGWVREEEAAPLRRRYVHAVALEALASPQVRCTRESLPEGDGGLGQADGPAVAAVAVEALRRRAQPEAWLVGVGGRQARLRPVVHAVDVASLGLSGKELAWVRSWEVEGGTVEALLVGAGVREQAALGLLEALEGLGLVKVEPPDTSAPATLGEREVVRLQAKLAGLERADYFEVLGLARDAGTPEVLRAWEQLRAEFEPLRYVGHPDTGLVHDAQRVCAALDEAVRALRDDALRAAYARYLVG